MMSKNLLLILSLGVILLSGSGCATLVVGGGAGAGTAAYIMGELKSMEEASIEKTWQAAQKAVEDLEFFVTTQQKDAFSAKLIARSATDKKIKISLKRESEKLTEVRIRVGIFGDEALSLHVLKEIRKNL